MGNVLQHALHTGALLSIKIPDKMLPDLFMTEKFNQ